MSCPPEPSTPSANRTLVVIVDTDRRVLTALAMTVDAEADLEVIAALSDPQLIWAAVPDDVPFVALVDLSGNGRDGDLDLVIGLSQLPNCRVVAMSVRPGLREAVVRAGATAFVVKGEDVEAILSAIREAVAPCG